jgi:hypothetical protein
MRKSSKTALTVGLVALAVGGAAAYAYAEMHEKTPAAPLPSGTLQTSVTLQPNVKYILAAVLPPEIKDQAALVKALQAAGWSNVTVNVFNGAGTTPSGGLVAPPNGYIASATWSGASNTPNPANVEIVAVA